MSEAKLVRADRGLVPDGDGWFVLNAADAEWKTGIFGTCATFEPRTDGERTFSRMGLNITHLGPGQPLCRYHGEDDEEFFLVLKGEALLLVEEDERPLKQWDLVHTPPWVDHVILGAGSGCAILAVGTRTGSDASGGLRYPRSDLALAHGAGVEEATGDPHIAYADVPADEPADFQADWLP